MDDRRNKFLDEYFPLTQRLIGGDGHGRQLLETVNRRFSLCGAELPPASLPAMLPGQMNMRGADGGTVWRGLTPPPGWVTVFGGQLRKTGGFYGRAIQRIKKDGKVKWEDNSSVVGDYIYSQGWKADISSNGNIYIVGIKQTYPDGGSLDENSTWRVEKFSQTGKFLWEVKDELGWVTDVAAEHNAVYAVGGKYDTEGALRGSRIVKYASKDGSLIWEVVVQRGGLASNQDEYACSCTTDAEYLYVAERIQTAGFQSDKQGRILTINKLTGATVSIFSDIVYSTAGGAGDGKPWGEFDVVVANRGTYNPANVFIIGSEWVAPLDGRWKRLATYYAASLSYVTLKLGIASDGKHIYTVGILNASLGGYEVKKWDFDGNLKWTKTTPPASATQIRDRFYISGISVDGSQVYISGYLGRMIIGTGAFDYARKQALDKVTGDIIWDEVDTIHNTIWWGVASTRVE